MQLYAISSQAPRGPFTKGSDSLTPVEVTVRYCGFPAVDSDPAYANVRALPEFGVLHAQAVQCHEQFMAALKGP